MKVFEEKNYIIKEMHRRIKNGRKNVRATVYFKNSKPQRLDAYGKTFVEAETALKVKAEKKAAELKHECDAANGELPLYNYVDKYISGLKYQDSQKRDGKKISQATITPIKNSCVTFIKQHSIGSMPISQINVRILHDWMQDLKAATYDKHHNSKQEHAEERVGYSVAHRNRAIKVLKAVIDDYCAINNLDSNPAYTLKLFKQAPKKKTEEDFMAESEMEAFVDVCDDKRKEKKSALMADFLKTALLTSSRDGECAALHVEDIDFDNKRVFFRRNRSNEKYIMKTNNSVDYVPIADSIIDILKDRCAGKSGDALVFETIHGNMIRAGNISNTFKKWIKLAGIDKNLRPHSMRGSMAINLMDNGGSVEAAACLLRNDVDTVKKYYYVLTRTEKEKRIANILSAFDNMPLCHKVIA